MNNIKQINSSPPQNKGLQLLLGILGIYSCYWSSGYLQQKILKQPYIIPNTNQSLYFDSPISLIWIQAGVAWILGYLINQKFYPSQKRLPSIKMLICAILVTVSTLSSIFAIKITSFPIVMMIKSCSIIPVVFVGIFCSKVKDHKLKLGPQKIVIALFISIGILVYNFGGTQSYYTKQSSLFGVFLMFISILADGFLPDIQAVIKSQCDPLPTEMFQHTNKWVFLMSLFYAAATGSISYLFQFGKKSHQCIGELMLFSILGAIGQIFIYRLVRQFKQHIVPFVITTRKILTVVISILVYKHSTTLIQIGGIGIVFICACYQYCSQIFWDGSNKSKQQRQKQQVVINIDNKDDNNNDNNNKCKFINGQQCVTNRQIMSDEIRYEYNIGDNDIDKVENNNKLENNDNKIDNNDNNDNNENVDNKQMIEQIMIQCQQSQSRQKLEVV